MSEKKGLTLTAGSVKRIDRVCSAFEREKGTLLPAGMTMARRQATAGLVPVYVTKDGGFNGTRTAYASWTYTVRREEGGSVLVAEASPVMRRKIKASTIPAVRGLARLVGGVWELWDVDEQYGQNNC
jgi:hypothetical protein